MRFRVAVPALALIVTAVVYYIFQINDELEKSRLFLAALHPQSWSVIGGSTENVDETTSSKNKTVIFSPFFDQSDDLHQYYRENLEKSGRSDVLHIIQHALVVRSKVADSKNHNYGDNSFQVYDIARSESGDCSDMGLEFKVKVSSSKKLDDIRIVAETYLQQHKLDPALQELDGFIKEDIKEQLSNNTVAKHWYKFAGSSVWLQEYGVHLMISRVMYSSHGVKRWFSIHTSLLFAQVYDEDWNELKDVELVLPDANEVVGYRTMLFPCFLPMPFYHNSKFQKKRNYGAEDPRVILVGPTHGRQEPMVVYNSYHRKVRESKMTSDTEAKLEFEMFRLMFMAWPFRTQRGKDHVQGYEDARFSQTTYIRAAELLIQDEPRAETLKNWTPFVSHESLEMDDQAFMYFVTRWDSLEVIKCPLNIASTEGFSKCRYEFKKDEHPNEEIGPFRGGTEMLHLRSIAPQVDLHGKDVWVGFARAHILQCGCGRKMYRPNLVVMAKENGNYNLTQIGAFTSFNVAVRGWGSDSDTSQCGARDASVLLPNGISSWFPSGDGLEEDVLTLSVSVADDTVEIVHVRGVLDSLIKQTSIAAPVLSGNDTAVMECCITGSREFCRLYGEEQLALGHLDPTSPQLKDNKNSGKKASE